MIFQLSQHFKDQMQLRNINISEIEEVLNNPQQKLTEDGLTVYQKPVEEKGKQYLLRIFVNELKQPPVAVTVYKTSKITKYLQP